MARAADDFSSIAARLSQLERPHKCTSCKDTGWRYKAEFDEFLECGYCGNPEEKDKPK